MGDYIILTIVAIVLAAAIIYIIRQKKNGAKCIGCPSGCKCCSKGKNEGSCCCVTDAQDKVK